MSTSRVRKLLLCVCGGYQAYTVPGFIVELLLHFADDVQVVLSRSAVTMVAKDAVEVASRNPVYVEATDRAADVYVPHIELTRNVDVTLVFPATVNLLGKLANGITDELIPALLLASETPTVIVPVANDSMMTHPATIRNLEILRGDGYLVVDAPSAMEIATREGMEEHVGSFPYPPLLMYLSSVVSRKVSAIPARPKS